MATLQEYGTGNWNTVFKNLHKIMRINTGKSDRLSPWEDPSKEHQPWYSGQSNHRHESLWIFMSNMLF